jgi:hypothetical protein
MEELNKYINTFGVILNDLNKFSSEKNVRLGGSVILKLHGLKFSRASGDLDIVIYKPSDKQLAYVKGLSFLHYDNGGYHNDINYKIKKDNLIINILIADAVKVQPSYLTYTYNENSYSIISIDEVIEAKKKYGRPKDISDFILLKNENFNL